MSTAQKFGPVRVASISRERANGHHGNPRYVLHTDDGDYRTGVDAQIGYSITNYTNSRFPDTYVIGDNVPAVMLIGDSRSAIWAIELNGERI